MEIVTGQHRQRAKTFLKWAFRAAVIFCSLLIFCLASLWLYAKILGAPKIQVPQTTVYYSTNDEVIGETEHDSQNRYWVSLSNIAKPLQQATIDIEDRHFYDHHGFDLRRMAGAAIKDVTTLSKAQGASTISMQYARNLFLSNDKTWKRKFLEAFTTMRLEMNYSKSQILEGYLNTIYYGHGAYGIQAASKYYFNKNAKDLDLAESALLAGIPKGPTYYAPDVDFDRSKARQRLILNAMVNAGDITKAQAEKAYKEKLTLVTTHKGTKEMAPYFQDEVQQELSKRLNMTNEQIATAGLKVYTTLDANMQKKAEYWVKKVINPKSKIQAALVTMDPKTGAVKAMIGGRNYQEDPYNLAVQGKRQPGSSFKPFLYYAALRNNFTPSTTLLSAPTTFHYDNGKPYSPENYGGYYANGPITLMQALALSDNIYAVKTNLAIGMDQLVTTAKEMGITSPLEPIPSLALGTKPVSVLEMANAYSTIADLGKRVTPHYITKVVDRSGHVIYQWKPSSKQVLDPATSFVLSQMMTGIFDPKLNGYSTVTGNSVRKILTHTVAAKTGSTDTDSWMVGFTPNLTTSVWVGYKQWKPINTYPDSRYSKSIWANYMEDVLQGQPRDAFKAPDGVVKAWVDPSTGLLTSKDAKNARLTYYLAGTEPTQSDQTAKDAQSKNGADSLKHDQHKSGGLVKWVKHLFSW
ncbi:PBP1A family penicillin-binding protein [Pullulanibacillus sp. KACC 23026]|uniref:transglycosylase domain-containing protein n=1 Tax=Pullulanibacillus sp. KACC 23026 TaxID=3028315 RepID=UPI0023B01006|nr:PBP1A family penicillin-binding protein [Pullulanibacillus sp. KACC 23026]WEG13073.1 PBP1A family penicillin-binding protein [Pullulanibacillus sp. KACC 23026]